MAVPTGLLAIVLLLITAFIIVYKRQMLIKMFSINIASMADEFRTQMEVTADQAVKKLDNQMAQLEYMLEEADAKILALETRLQQAEQKCICQTPTEVSQTINDIPFAGVSVADPQLRNELEQQISSLKGQVVSSACAPLSQPLPQSAGRHQDVAPDRRKQVISMHQQGYNVVEIAKATAMGKGEVMLVLELNKNC
jgi:ElaB/YqjD/DUF883 family membrane-anchored ribosome-binding protein